MFPAADAPLNENRGELPERHPTTLSRVQFLVSNDQLSPIFNTLSIKTPV